MTPIKNFTTHTIIVASCTKIALLNEGVKNYRWIITRELIIRTVPISCAGLAAVLYPEYSLHGLNCHSFQVPKLFCFVERNLL